MPVTCSVDSVRAHVRITLEGEFTSPEIHETLTRIAADASLANGFTVLADHRRISRPITPSQMSELMAVVGGLVPRFEGVRWAIVVGSGPSYGMMNLLAADVGHAAGIEVGIFFDEPAAEEWLATGGDGDGGQR